MARKVGMSPAEVRARILAGARIAGGANESTAGMTQEELIDLLPEGAAADLWGKIGIESTALQLARTVRLSETTEKWPVQSLRPQASWTNPRYGGRKRITAIKWEVKEIVAEEIAATLAIPDSWLRDARRGNFNPEGDVETSMSEAASQLIDESVLFGEGNQPAVFPNGGLMGAASVSTDTDALDAVDKAMSELEDHNLTASGIASRPVIGTALRKAYRDVAALPGERPALNLYGVPVSVSKIWNQQDEVDAIVGDFQYVVVAIREDIAFARSNDGVLMDDDGNIVANAFQDNLTLIKMFMRMGYAIGEPIDPITNEPVKAFAGAKWTT